MVEPALLLEAHDCMQERDTRTQVPAFAAHSRSAQTTNGGTEKGQVVEGVFWHRQTSKVTLTEKLKRTKEIVSFPRKHGYFQFYSLEE